MSKPPRKRPLSPNAHRALELLASTPRGATEEMLIYGHGFSRQQLAGLVRAGLATVRRKVITAGATAVEVGKVMITAAGRRAIEQ